jgi:DNA-binding NarL/FixJ family response regulator
MSAAKVVLLSQDLMFGSKVEGMIRAAQAEPVLTGEPAAALDAATDSALLIVDLTADAFDGTTVVAAEPVKTIGFYAHTDDETRKKALSAGFERVVPRSRMMREGVEIIAGLVAGS